MYERLMKELESTGISFKDGGWRAAPGTDYGIVTIDGPGDTVWADDAMQEQAMAGTVHLFTRDDGKAQMKAVQAAMNRASVSWRFSNRQFEEDTRLTHWAWRFELEAI